MTKNKAVKFLCTNCGEEYSAWSGKCRNCGEWNSLEEQVDFGKISKSSGGLKLKPENINKAIKEKLTRIPTGLKEVDEVLGSGFVPGSVTLMAGQPGIGKSTLLIQIASNIAKTRKTLYVTGEESARQVALRADRLGLDNDRLELVTSNSANDIAATIGSGKYEYVVIDSIQSITVDEINSAAGNISQITNSAHILTSSAKSTNTAITIVGHVTKEGSIAGPKVLEHVVDVVLQLEGDRYGGFKILRSVKNRFGSTNEAGIFEMTDKGLVSVSNPSAALLAERQDSDGSIVMATMEGTRALLVEVQALVNPTSYGYPKRAASGIDLNRVNLLIAVMEKRTKLKLADKDIYINIVGGIKITEPAADLAVCMAIASACKGLKLKKNAVVFGEVGLSGEVRHVPFLEKRMSEAIKLGYDYVIGPKMLTGKKPLKLNTVNDLRSALNAHLSA